MGKAKLRKTAVDIIKQNEIDKKKAFGIARNNFTGIVQAGSSSAQGLANGSVGGTQDTESYLKTSGDTMVGSMAFYPKSLTVASGSISLLTAVGTNVASSTSRVVLLGEGGSADNLLTINGATHAGQILFIQAVLTTPITLVTGTGNIYIPNGSDYVISGKDIVLLQWDTINTTWTMISGNSTGGVGLGDTNNWTGVNTFANSVSFNGSTTTVGDDVNDVFTLYGKMGSDINMSTYDINNVDRLKFSTTVGSGTSLASTDTGMEARYSGGSPYGMHIQFPSTNSSVLTINRGSTEMVNINSLGTVFNSDIYASNNQIKQVATPTATTDAANKAYVDAAAGGGSTSFIGFTADAALDMATLDIERVGQIEFSSTSHYIKSNSVGFEYRVPVGDDHEFFVNGISEFKVEGGLCTVKNSLQVDDDATLGSTSADSITVNGLVNYATNYSAVGLPAATSAGYITIQVGGVAKKLYYYS